MEQEPEKPAEKPEEKPAYAYPGPAHEEGAVDEKLAAKAARRAARRYIPWGRTLSEPETKALLVWLTESVYKKVASELRREFNLAADTGLTALNLKGTCGLAQSLGMYALEDCKIPHRPLAMQTLDKYYQGHVALVLPLKTSGGVKHFLIDPTARQFFEEKACTEPNPYGHPFLPGHYMTARPGGPEMADELLRRGYIELTPARARIYAASFCAGRDPFETDEAAFAHLTAPPAHKEADKMNGWFRRAELKEKGLLLPRPAR